MTQRDRFDNFYITIVKEIGGIEGLFHSIFSFLLRRTDFYYEMSPGDKMGFPPGDAQKMVQNIFKSYQQEYWKKFPRKPRSQYESELKAYQEKLEKLKPQAPASKKRPGVGVKNEDERKEESKPVPQPKIGNIKTKEEEENRDIGKPIIRTKKDEDRGISTYNGGKNEKYKWSQNITEVIVQIDLEKKTRAKELEVELRDDYVSIKRKDGSCVYIEGELYDNIKEDESTWNIEDQETIILNLEKSTENIWKTVCKGDPEIDTTKVDNSKDISQFDGETQGALRKIVYEQRRKAQGLPSSEDEQKMEMLKKAWNAEGSPFKGQPFDPSKLNIPGMSQVPPDMR